MIRIVLITSLLSSFFTAFSQEETNSLFLHYGYKHPIYDSLVREYKITSIKRITNAYAINIEDVNNIRFTIVSLKYEKLKTEKIQKGKKYHLLLHAYDDPKVIRIGDPMHRKIVVGDEVVDLKEDFKTGIIVTTPNLQGLYYTPPE